MLLVAVAGDRNSYGLMLLFGFFLGIGGTTFAVGIPFVNAWFEADRRGFATGVFGAGMGGTALSAFFTPRFVDWFGYVVTHVIIAAALVGVAFLVWTAMRDSPPWQPNTDPVVPKLAAALRLPVTWQMSFLYAVAFGGFVAFSTYLPTYLKDVYEFDLTGAGTRTAGFAIAAVIARPIGGVLSDKAGPRKVAATAFAGAAVMAVVVALQPEPEVPAGLSFVLMAAFLGLGTGGVFAWVAAEARQGAGRQRRRDRRRRRRSRRVLPAVGHGRDVRRGRPQLHDRPHAALRHRGRGAGVHAVRDSEEGGHGRAVEALTHERSGPHSRL